MGTCILKFFQRIMKVFQSILKAFQRLILVPHYSTYTYKNTMDPTSKKLIHYREPHKIFSTASSSGHADNQFHQIERPWDVYKVQNQRQTLTDLPPPLFLCAICSGSWSALVFFKSALSRGSKISKLLTSALFMSSKIKKAPKKSGALFRR